MAEASDTLTNAVAEFSKRAGVYRDFAACIRDLVTHIIANHGIVVHSVTCRAKDPDSLSRKLQKPGKSYKALEDVTDLAGVRVITYFTDDAEKVSDLIESEFDIDRDHSIDKRRLLEPHEFGYLSIHHVACLPAQRVSLAEYSKFKGLKVEIQTRSILQHAWAEIEHDLGYKVTTEVPKQLRRRISRLAGLLELADQEFQLVRTDITSYERNLPRLVVERPASVDLDKSSLEAYVRQSKPVQAIDKRIADASGGKLSDNIFVDYAVTRLAWLGISHLGNLDELLNKHADDIFHFAIVFFLPKNDESEKTENRISRGTSLFYLAYVLVCQRPADVIEHFVREVMPMRNKAHSKSFAEHLRETWAQVVKQRTQSRKLERKQ